MTFSCWVKTPAIPELSQELTMAPPSSLNYAGDISAAEAWDRLQNDPKAQLIDVRTGVRDRRQRLLSLSKSGVQLEAELFGLLRERMSAAYADAGQEAVTGFWKVLEGLIPEEERPRVFALQRGD